MRILIAACPGVGHLLPVLPIALEAAARDHDVAVATGADLAPLLRRAGLRHAEIGPPGLAAGFSGIPGLAELGGRQRLLALVSQGFAGIFADAFSDGILALAAEWRPDVIVHEDMEMGSWIAAEVLGIPHVVVQATAWRPAVRRIAADTQNAVRARHGLAADPALDGQDGALWFTTRPPSLQDPGAPLPPSLRELRTAADDRVGGERAATGLPAWLESSARPRVAVTFGTVNAHRTDLLGPILAGLADLDLDVVVAGVDPATLDAIPANARVEPYVPMSELLPRSAAVIHHAGSGTMLAAAAAGTPQVMIPLAADQPENAAAAVRAGIAVAIRPEELTADGVARATRRLLDERPYRDRAGAVAAEIAAMPDAAAALAEIVETCHVPATSPATIDR